MAYIKARCVKCNSVLDLKINLSSGRAFCPNCGDCFIFPDEENVIDSTKTELPKAETEHNKELELLIDEAKVSFENDDFDAARVKFEEATIKYPTFFDSWYEYMCFDIAMAMKQCPPHCISIEYISKYMSMAKEKANDGQSALIEDRLAEYRKFAIEHNSHFEESLYPIKQLFSSINDLYSYLKKQDYYLEIRTLENGPFSRYIVAVGGFQKFYLYNFSDNFVYNKRSATNYDGDICKLIFDDGITVYFTNKLADFSINGDIYPDAFEGYIWLPSSGEKRISIDGFKGARDFLGNSR